MAGAAGLWLVLATDGGNREWVLAALLRWWPLAVVGLRLVLELVLFMGMGAVPLWPLVPLSALRLGLVPGSRLGAGVGLLAPLGNPLRLGSAAAWRSLCRWNRLDPQRGARRRRRRFRPPAVFFHLCSLRPLY